MAKFYVESMVCRSYGGDSGDWWIESDVVDVPDGQTDTETYAIHKTMIRTKLGTEGCFIAGIYPYSISEYDEEEDEL